jgi:hypothetical protein
MTAKNKTMPKGGRKGGKVFPRITLTEAVGYARKLVSKTHTGPQSKDVVLMGVIGSKHDKGVIGMSALKQYGLMTGDAKSGFSAAELAKAIASAPAEEVMPLYRTAALTPPVFKSLFDTYHGDTISRAKLRQRAADLAVHPDETTNCVELYVGTMSMAELVTLDGDQVAHVSAAETADAAVKDEPTDLTDKPEEDPSHGNSSYDAGAAALSQSGDGGAGDGAAHVKQNGDRQIEGNGEPIPRAIFNVNVTLDASLDVEKLEKQLALLRQYGAL